MKSYVAEVATNYYCSSVIMFEFIELLGDHLK